MNTVETILLVLVFILIIAIVFLFIYIIKDNRKDNYKDIRLNLNKDFLSLTKSLNKDFNELNENTNFKLRELENKLNDNFSSSKDNTKEIFAKINERMIKIDETQKSLTNLSNDIISLKSILQDKKNRGTFGEIELYSLLESSFGDNNKRWEKQHTLSNGLKVDAVVFGSDNLGKICIDSKFPLENYRRIHDDSLTKSEKDKASTAFRNDVFKHLNDIRNKYIIPGETAEIAYMFIPSEAVFAEIYGSFQEIVDKSYELKVYIVSPTTLMAYLTAIRSIYLGQKKDEKAKEIAILLNELSIEFSRLKDRTEALQRDFERIIPDFEKVAVTSNKIIKRFASINAGEIDDEDE